MHFETALREFVEQLVDERVGSVSIEPELITIEQAAEICDCDKSVILTLLHERETNGFPAIVLGRRTIRIDKGRLNVWFRAGGLNGTHQETERRQISHPRFERNGQAADIR